MTKYAFTVLTTFSLDALTVYWMAGLVCLLTGIAAAVMRTLHPPSRAAINALAWALTLAGAAMLMAASAGAAPAWLSGWLALVSAGGCAALLLESIRRLYGGQSRMDVMLGSVGFLSVVLKMAPDPAFSLLVHSGFAAICCIAAAVVAARGRDPIAPRERWILCALCSALALAAASRFAQSWNLGVPTLLEQTGRLEPLLSLATALYMLAPLLLTIVMLAIAHARQLAALSHQASTDELTGAASRRFLFANAEAWLAAPGRAEAHAALMMIDIDRFKAINDRYGPATGDRVLRHVADVLQKTLRRDSLLARYGGEEFCALVPVQSEADARAVAEHLRKAVERSVFADASGVIGVTASIGLALHRTGHTLQDVLNVADRRVYKAKTEGRNRVVSEESKLEMAVV